MECDVINQWSVQNACLHRYKNSSRFFLLQVRNLYRESNNKTTLFFEEFPNSANFGACKFLLPVYHILCVLD